jgi:predicted solute-binding protein
VALLQALYYRVNGELPRVETERPERIPERLGPEDGGLLIGDGALQFRAACAGREAAGEAPEFTIFDLGRWWHETEGLPFVFALWAYPRNKALPDRLFEDSLSAGEERIEEIIATAGWAGARRYLTENLHYRLGPPELAALVRFRERLATAGLL